VKSLVDVDFNLIIERESQTLIEIHKKVSKLDYQIVIHNLDRLVHEHFNQKFFKLKILIIPMF
jgi:hypothetical protein